MQYRAERSAPPVADAVLGEVELGDACAGQRGGQRRDLEEVVGGEVERRERAVILQAQGERDASLAPEEVLTEAQRGEARVASQRLTQRRAAEARR